MDFSQSKLTQVFLLKGSTQSRSSTMLCCKKLSLILLVIYFQEHFVSECDAGAQRWCEKTPRNLLFADLIAEVFPDAKFINVVRDGRDVSSSMLERQFWPIARSNRFECTSKFGGELTLEKCAQYWSCLSQIGKEMEGKLGRDKCLTVRFEDVAKEPDITFNHVLDFLEEPFDPSVLDLDSRIIRRRNPGSISWPDVAHIGRWQNDLSLEQKKLFQEIAGEQLTYFGYPLL